MAVDQTQPSSSAVCGQADASNGKHQNNQHQHRKGSHARSTRYFWISRTPKEARSAVFTPYPSDWKVVDSETSKGSTKP